jgi:hypothetical protein
MIRECLVQAFQTDLADHPGRYEAEGNLVATFPAAHPEVGDVRVWDDGDEATVGIGDITHFHVNPYDSALSQTELEGWVAGEVVRFLHLLFEDRVLLWKGTKGGSGGSKELDSPPTSVPVDPEKQWFLWSGPIRERR